jgi:glycosyltransferase involved in cell wall biosynthesis
MAKRILIYYPFNLESVSTESQAQVLLNLGYEVFLLTWAEEGALHINCRVKGVHVFSAYNKKYKAGPLFFLHHISFLRRFCKKNKIDKVISHIQSTGMTAGLALIFQKKMTYYVRHNSDYFQLRNSTKELWINSLANKLSYKILAISDKVREQLLKEGVKENKIARVDLCYDFAAFGLPDLQKAEQIKTKYRGDIILLIAARLDPLKRHKEAIEAVKALKDDGINATLLCIGDGEEKARLAALVEKNGLNENIFLLGFTRDVINYYSACDILLHLSYSEASSHVAKEAGIFKKPVIVCKGVGDFDEYLIDGKNAFLVDKEQPVKPTVELIKEIYKDKDMLQNVGSRLSDTVYHRFSIAAVTEQYKRCLEE